MRTCRCCCHLERSRPRGPQLSAKVLEKSLTISLASVVFIERQAFGI